MDRAAFIAGSSSSDKVHQLYRISIGERRLAELRTPYDLPVDLHHHGSRIKAEMMQQIRSSGRGGNPGRLSVHENFELRPLSSSQGANIAIVAAAGSAACQRLRMAATP